MIVDDLIATAEDVHAGTGWAVKPEGACKGDVCVPLPDDVRTGDGLIDLQILANALGMAVVHDPEIGLWSIGPESLGGHVLTTAEAPELVLPDLGGNEVALSSLRGQKVLLVAWAPY